MKPKKQWMSIFGILCLPLAVVLATPQSRLSDHYQPDKGWRRASPEQQGISSAELIKIFDNIKEKKIGVHSLIIVRNGHLVLEAYFYPFQRNWVHDVASVTKSMTALATGIAIDQGYLKSVNEPALGFFNDYIATHPDENKKSLTIEHLLTMTSGFCRDIDNGEEQPGRMRASGDCLRFMLDLPLASKPGSAFVYCSLAPHLLSAIITKATGMNLLKFAQKNLFGPLGINAVRWEADPQGNSHGWGDLLIRPINLARIGSLLLNEGSWRGKPIASKGWVHLMSTPHVSEDEGTSYGYLWWIPKRWPGLFEARGRGGQRFVIWPQKNLVVVVIGSGGYNKVGDLRTSIIQAIKSDGPLPQNREATKLLESKIEIAGKAPAPKPPAPLPPIVRRISGHEYLLDPNPLGLKSFSLDFSKGVNAAITFSTGGVDGKSPNAKVIPIGLDGVYRVSNTSRYNLPAGAKGSWVTDHDFDLIYNEAVNNRIFNIHMCFEGNTAEWRITEDTGLFKPITIIARLAK